MTRQVPALKLWHVTDEPDGPLAGPMTAEEVSAVIARIEGMASEVDRLNRALAAISARFERGGW